MKKKSLLSLMGVVLLALVILVGCGKKTVKVELPENVAFVQEGMDANKLRVNSVVELLITPPDGEELDKLMINDEDKTSIVVDNKFTVKIQKGLSIVVTFKDIPPETVNVSLPEGVSLVDSSLNASSLLLDSDVELKITIPEGKVLDKLTVNGENMTYFVADNKITIRVVRDLTVSISFRTILVSVVLPEGISLVDDTLKINSLEAGTDVEFLITPPEGQEVNVLRINDEVANDLIVDGKFIVRIALGLTIEVSYKDIGVETTSLTLPEAISLVDKTLDSQGLVVGSEVELEIAIPKNQEIESLMIGGEERKDDLDDDDDTITITVVEGLVIEVSFKNKRVSVELPEGISLVDDTLDANDLEANTEVEILITPPEGKELNILKVNDIDVT